MPNAKMKRVGYLYAQRFLQVGEIDDGADQLGAVLDFDHVYSDRKSVV